MDVAEETGKGAYGGVGSHEVFGEKTRLQHGLRHNPWTFFTQLHPKLKRKNRAIVICEMGQKFDASFSNSFNEPLFLDGRCQAIVLHGSFTEAKRHQ